MTETSTRRLPPILPAFFASVGVAAGGAGAGLVIRSVAADPGAITQGENAAFVWGTVVVFVLGSLFVSGIVGWMGAHNLLLTGRPKVAWWAWCGALALAAAVVALNTPVG